MAYQHTFKILILGDAGVGKSCLMWRFTQNRFTAKHQSTVGMDFKQRNVEVCGTNIRLQVWDTAGAERFRTIVRSYYRGAHGVLLVFDTTSMQSFQNMSTWLKELKRFNCEHINIILVGNKCDAYEKREVSFKCAESYAERLGIKFFEVSAKSGINVDKTFESLAVQICERLVLCKPKAKDQIEIPDEPGKVAKQQQLEQTDAACCTCGKPIDAAEVCSQMGIRLDTHKMYPCVANCC